MHKKELIQYLPQLQLKAEEAAVRTKEWSKEKPNKWDKDEGN